MNTVSAPSAYGAVATDALRGASFNPNSLASVRTKGRDEQLKIVSKEFAALMVQELYSTMHEGISTEGVGFGGSAEGLFRDLSDAEYAREAAGGSGGGGALAELVFQSLTARGARAAETPKEDAQ